MPRKFSYYLVLSSHGSLRVVRRVPRLAWNEAAFPVSVTVPDTWGRVQPRGLEIAMPDPNLPDPEIPSVEGEPITSDEALAGSLT